MSHLIDYFLAWEISEYIILFIIEDPVEQNEDDPLTTLKNVKAAHSMGGLKMPKGGGNKKVKPIASVEAKKGGLKGVKEFGTADDKTAETEEC